MVSSDDEANENNVDTGSGDEVEDEDEFEVERVLKMRVKRGGKREFLVKWNNYTEEHNSWEPEENLGGAQDALDAFLAANPDKGGSGSKRGGAKKRGGSGAQSTPKSTNKSKAERGDDEDEAEETNEQSDDDDSGDDFATPSKAKRTKKEDTGKKGSRKKSSAADAKTAASSSGRKSHRSTSTSHSHKPPEDSLVREGIKPKQEHGETSTPIGQTKAVNSRMAMSKSAAFSWLESDGDESDSEKGEGTKGRGGTVDGDENGKKKSQENNNGSIAEHESAQKQQQTDNNGPIEGAKEKQDDAERGSAQKQQQQNRDGHVESPPPPVDPSVGNGHNHTINNSMEEAFSEHDPTKDLGSVSHRRGRATSTSSSGTIAAKISDISKNRREHSGTFTPLDNDTGLVANTARTRSRNDDRRTSKPQLRVEARNRKSAAKADDRPVELRIHAIYRDNDNKLMAVANIGTSTQCGFAISDGAERKIMDILKKEAPPMQNNDE